MKVVADLHLIKWNYNEAPSGEYSYFLHVILFALSFMQIRRLTKKPTKLHIFWKWFFINFFSEDVFWGVCPVSFFLIYYLMLCLCKYLIIRMWSASFFPFYTSISLTGSLWIWVRLSALSSWDSFKVLYMPLCWMNL